MVDPSDEMLTVYRWTPEGFLPVFAPVREERASAETFEAVEPIVGALRAEEEPADDDA